MLSWILVETETYITTVLMEQFMNQREEQRTCTDPVDTKILINLLQTDWGFLDQSKETFVLRSTDFPEMLGVYCPERVFKRYSTVNVGNIS